ncbi:MAG: amino acid permease [Desulfotomaculales bacterium]
MADNRSIWRVKPIDDLLEEKRQTGLTRVLGTVDLVALGIGAIIGTGIFVLTGVAAAQYAGPSLVVSFIVSGLAAGLAALVYAELAPTIPVAGSAYTYTYAALGEFVAWVVGWNLMLEYMVASGAVAIGWGSYFTDLLASLGVLLPKTVTNAPGAGGIINLPAVLVSLLITLLVIRGTKQSASINKLAVTAKLGVIVFFIIVGGRFINPENWTPFLPFGVAGIFHGAAIIFFAYIGFDAVATAAEETRRPQRDLPLGIIGSLSIATVLYILVTLVLTGLVPYTALNTASPVASALLAAGVRGAGGIVSLGAIAGITSVLLVMIYAQSRVFFAMARDGLLPPVFTRIHARYKTPYVTVVVTGAVVVLTAGFLPIEMVAQLANIGTLTAFVITSAGVLILRRTRPDIPRPFKVPGAPVTPILAVAFCVYLMFNLPSITWVRFAVWMSLGLLVYFLYSYRHSALAPQGTDPKPRLVLPGSPAAKPGRKNGDGRR